MRACNLARRVAGGREISAASLLTCPFFQSRNESSPRSRQRMRATTFISRLGETAADGDVNRVVTPAPRLGLQRSTMPKLPRAGRLETEVGCTDASCAPTESRSADAPSATSGSQGRGP